jgi:hypothetical protein
MSKKPDLTKLPKYISIVAKEISGVAVGGKRLSDIPVVHLDQYNTLTAADADICEVIARIPASVGQKGAGAYYGSKILKQMADTINARVLPGYEGHIDEDERGTKKPEIVTYWVAALYDEAEDALYVRGLVANDEDKLKLEVRANIGLQVSLYGPVAYEWAYKEDGTGYLNVIDLKLESLDWTPIDAAGMPTTVVVATEMEGGDDIMNLKELALKAKELGITVEQLVAEMDSSKVVIAGEQFKKLATHTKIATEINQIADKTLTDDELVAWVLDLVSQARVIGDEKLAALIKEVVAVAVQDPAVQAVVGQMASFNAKGKTKEQLATEVAGIVAKQEIQDLIVARSTNPNFSRQYSAGANDHKGVNRVQKQL